jgi:autotransporter-associated beta strand protein
VRIFYHRFGAARRWLTSLLAASALCVAALPAAAQDATWLNAPGSGDFNTAANWTPATVPTGTAFFGTSGLTALSFSANTTVSGWTFNPGAAAYSFTNSGQNLSFVGAGIVINGGSAAITNNVSSILNFNNSATAGNAIITNNGFALNFLNTATAGSATITNNSFVMHFNDNSTAGSATITNNASLLFDSTATAGNATITNNAGAFNNFVGTSTAGNAIITNDGTIRLGNRATGGNAVISNNGLLQLQDFSTAGNAAITNNGLLRFVDTSDPGNATIINGSAGVVDFSVASGNNNDRKFSAGSIAGGGNFYLGSNQLTVGGNNLSTVVSGVISDCGTGGVACLFAGSVGGSLVKAGTGTLTLTGANTYTGGTTVNAGTLLLAGAGTLGAVVGATTVTNATLDLGGTAQTQNGGVTLIGGVISNGTLSSSGRFSLQAGTVSAALAGSGNAVKSGTGLLNLTGISTYTGPTAVNGGTLAVNGSIAPSPLTTVNAGATLTGTGTVGNILVTGGTFAPGSGTAGSSMTVTGSLGFNAASTYAVNVNPTNSSFATVSGLATLGGATVNATFANGSDIAKKYTILNAGSVSGAFGAVTSTNLPANIHNTLSYDATHAYLNLDLNFTTASGTNGNQNNVANGLINYFNSNGGIPLIFATLSPSGLSQASGETATGSQQTTFNAMTQFMGLMTDPFTPGRGDGANAPGFAEEDLAAHAYASSGKPRSKSEREANAAIYSKSPLAKNYDPRWNVWAAGFGGSQTTDGSTATGSNSSTSRLFGVAAGADYIFSPRTIAGFALAGGGTSFSVVNGGSGRSDLFQAGAFIRHTVGQAYVTGALAYGWQDVTTDRTVTIAGVDRLRAQFNANAFSGRAEAGYRFVSPWIGGIGITPYAAGQFTTFDLPAYTEQVVSGASTFALAYGSKSVTATRSEFGLRADKSFALQTAILTLRGRGAWAHDFNPDRAVGAIFQTLPGASFVVNGARPASDSALATASAEFKWMNGWSATGTFEGEFSNVTRSYAGKGVARYVW